MSQENLKKNMLWNAAGNLLYLFAQWLLTVLVARLWGFYEAGVFSIALSVSAPLATLSLFGIRYYQVSDTECRYSDTVYTTLRALTSLLSLAICPLAVVLLGYGGETLLSTLFYMLFRLAECYSDVLHGISQKNGRLDLAGKGFALKSAALLLGFGLGYMLFQTLSAAVGIMAVFSWITTLFFDLPMAKRLSAFSLFRAPKEALLLGKRTFPLFIYLFFYSATTTAAKYLLELRFGEEVLGAYSSIFAPALLLSAAATYLYNPFTPTFASLHAEGKNSAFLWLAAKIVLALTGILAVCSPICALLGEWGLALLFGNAIRPFAYMLFPILLSVFGTALFGFLCMLAVTVRAFSVLTASSVLCLALTCALSHLFLRTVGENGASYGLCAAYFIAGAVLFGGILYRLYHPKKELS